MSAPEGSLQHAGAHLRGADQGTKADGARKRQTACLQQNQEVDRDHGHDDRSDGQTRGKDCEGGAVARAPRAQRRSRTGNLPCRSRPLRFARHAEQIKRKDHDDADCGIGGAGTAPTEPLDEQCAQRPAYGAGEAAEQRQLRYRAARVLAIEAAKGGKGRIVKPGPHGAADHQPRSNEHQQVRRDSLHQQADRQQDGAGGQHRAAAETFDEMPDTRRHHAGNQQAQREGANDPGSGPAGFARDGSGEDRKQVIRGSPDEDLPDSNRGDDQEARTIGTDAPEALSLRHCRPRAGSPPDAAMGIRCSNRARSTRSPACAPRSSPWPHGSRSRAPGPRWRPIRGSRASPGC